MLSNFLAHWKTSVAGILSFLVTTLTCLTGYLGTMDAVNTGSIHTPAKVVFGINIVLALCRAWIGLLQKDAGTTPATLPGSPAVVSVPSHEVPDSPVAKAVIPSTPVAK